MKTIWKLIALSAVSAVAAHGQSTTTESVETHTSADGTTTETTTTTTTFTPEVQTRVVEYFDEYKTQTHGLPPAVIERVKVDKVPRTWVTTRIEPGVVIAEEQREYLVEPPAELVRVLPELSTETHRYYIAGGNVVTVDTESYRVVDSLRIPSVKIEVD